MRFTQKYLRKIIFKTNFKVNWNQFSDNFFKNTIRIETKELNVKHPNKTFWKLFLENKNLNISSKSFQKILFSNFLPKCYILFLYLLLCTHFVFKAPINSSCVTNYLIKSTKILNISRFCPLWRKSYCVSTIWTIICNKIIVQLLLQSSSPWTMIFIKNHFA